MKAIVLTNYGGPEKLELREVPDPRPGPGQVAIRAAATSVNAIDRKLRSGALREWIPLALPAILGRDVSGEVVERGPDVAELAVGDRVLGVASHTYAERVVAPVSALAKLPPGLDLRDAAALPLVVLTGAELIEEAVRPTKGETVLVTGAVGGVGRAAVFAARKLGARVFAGVRERQKTEAAELGADRVVALDRGDEIAGLPKLDAIADTVGGSTIASLLGSLRKGGRLGSVVGEPPGAKGEDIQVTAFVSQPDGRRLRELAEAVARGELKIPISKRLPLAEAREAHRLAERGGIGKVLITM
jgi:NADPH:quinone reductase-like Zn-dependent oxidoreductase